MVRDDLYITVPSFFRCPISLDVMRSPVSLCTGVTYDRSSIQRWLDGGNNTCPATMQVLSSTDLVPNLTLQRLIDVWSRSLRIDSPPPPPPPDSPLSPERVMSLAGTLTSSSSRSGVFEDSLRKISRFGRESEENRRFLARIDGFASNLLGLLLRNAGDKSLDSLELIVAVTEMVLSRVENLHGVVSSGLNSSLDGLIKTLSLLIQCGSVASRIASVRIVELFAINTETKLAIAAKEGLVLQLLKMLSPDTTSQALIEAALSCLISLSKPKRVKVALVSLQIIRKLSKLLAASNSMATVVEKSLKLLEAVSSCTEGRSALCDDAQCMELVLQRALKVSSEATERAVTILWSLCYLFGEERAREAVSQGNGLARILVVMQSNCSPGARQMSGDLVKLLSSISKCRLSGYDTKTTHIMPF